MVRSGKGGCCGGGGGGGGCCGGRESEVELGSRHLMMVPLESTGNGGNGGNGGGDQQREMQQHKDGR